MLRAINGDDGFLSQDILRSPLCLVNLCLVNLRQPKLLRRRI